MAEPGGASGSSGPPDDETTQASGASEHQSGDTFLRELARASEGSIDRALEEATPREQFAGTARFQVQARLGAGGFGAVYLAFDRALSVHVALKVLARPDARWLSRFKVEFRALGHLVHPNLATRYELLCDQGRWFFTMELVEGKDLLAHVRPGGRLDQGRLRAALPQLVEGVSTLHEAGMVHRDIKPSNVLVDGAGRVVLLDFGLVADLDPRASLEHDHAGTPKYMSPEQHLGERAGPPSDWYTVGVVLHEALAGTLPPAEGAVDEALAQAPPDLAALCRELLQRDPEARPRGAEVLARVGAGGRAAQVAAGAAPPFVGRQAELAALHEAARRVHELRAPGWAQIHGEPGIGKSALLARAVEDLRARDPRALVLRSRCHERETMPFKALDGVADALARFWRKLPAAEAAALLPADLGPLAQLFPVLERAPRSSQPPQALAAAQPAERFRRAAMALREIFGRLCQGRLVTLALDDLQWGDPDSAALLGLVLAPPGAPPLFVIGCHRSGEEEPSPVVDALERLRDGGAFEGAQAELELSPLTAAEAQELARGLARGAGARTIDGLLREGAGSPLFLTEVSLHRRDGSSPSLDAALLQKIAALPAAARALLEVVAVAGEPLALEVAVAAAGPASGEPASLAALRAGRLLRRRSTTRAGELEPYHGRIGDAVVRSLAPEALQSCEGRLAAALESAAAAAHAALAFERAARLYVSALARGAARDAVGRRSLCARLADAWAAAGRPEAAALAYDEARAGADPDTDAVLRSKVAEQLLRAGLIFEGLARTHDALQTLGLGVPRGWALCALASILARLALRRRGLLQAPAASRPLASAGGTGAAEATSGPAEPLPPLAAARLDAAFEASLQLAPLDPRAALLVHARGLKLALDAGDPRRLSRALAAEACLRACAPRGPDRSSPLVQRARELLGPSADPEDEATLAGFEAAIAFARGALRECRDRAADAEPHLADARLGTPFEALLRCWRGQALFLSGHWPELVLLDGVWRREHERRGDAFQLAVSSAQTGFLAPALADDPAALRSLVRELEEATPRLGFESPHAAAELPRAWEALHGGDGEAALREVAALWPKLRASRSLQVPMLAARFLHLRATATLLAAQQAATGSRHRRRRLKEAGRDARSLDALGLPAARALSALVRAGALAAAGDPDGVPALKACEAALAAHELHPFALAARRLRGQLTAGDEGQLLIAEADAWFRAKGAKAPARIAAMLVPRPAR